MEHKLKGKLSVACDPVRVFLSQYHKHLKKKTVFVSFCLLDGFFSTGISHIFPNRNPDQMRLKWYVVIGLVYILIKYAVVYLFWPPLMCCFWINVIFDLDIIYTRILNDQVYQLIWFIIYASFFFFFPSICLRRWSSKPIKFLEVCTSIQ